jgi:ribonucleoside-triphosphate reductase
MSVADKLLSDLVVYRTYAKFMPEQNRRESLNEAIERNMQMHMNKFPKLTDEINAAYKQVFAGNVMPSMRGLQFGGIATERNHIRQYNCSFHNIDRIAAFSETLYLLLCGTGVGYSVQWHHVKQLPKLSMPSESMYYVIHDSIEGWAMALSALIESFMMRKPEPNFDFMMIRSEGSLLKTTGGRAPGPAKLEKMLKMVRAKLVAAVGRKLRPIEAHDILCMIADCVRAGGVRESALIALFDRDDQEMLTCKSGEWWKEHPYRARANNSAMLPRQIVKYDEFVSIYGTLRASGSGEPAIYWTNDQFGYGANPCVEIALRHLQFCNLTTINQATIKSTFDLMERVKAATLIGTLQAAYTDFPFLDQKWKQVTESDALIGVSFTGIADSGDSISDPLLQEAAHLVVSENVRIAHAIDIMNAMRCTTGKPEGSSSAVLGTSSGLHARHGNNYLRRVGVKKNSEIGEFLMSEIPGLIEQHNTDDDKILAVIPQQAPEGSIGRESETALSVFNRAMKYNVNWIAPGHISGANRNNMSCTISVRENEWDDLREKMWEHRELYNGLSILPYDGGTYVQAPFEECDRATYERYMSMVKPLDFTKIIETTDTTEQSAEAACAGGSCELKF